MNKRVVIGVAVVLAGLLAGAAWYLTMSQPLEKAREAVANSLLDPGSAEFRGVFRTSDKAVCGEVNGKNRLGAYVGFRWFMVQDDVVIVDRDNEDLVMQLCARRKG